MDSKKKKLANSLYYQKNKEKFKIKAKGYYATNKDILIVRSKKYYQKLKERVGLKEINEQARKRYFRNREVALLWHKENHKKKRIALLEALGGGRCQICGFSDWRALQIDHIKGGGSKERNQAKQDFFRYLENLDYLKAKYQVICANCNWIKRYENKESREKGPSPYL